MKQSWNMSRHSAPGRVTRRRVGGTLMRVAMAGAVSLPIPIWWGLNERTKMVAVAHVSKALGTILPVGDLLVSPRRTGGAVIEAWAFGTLSDARQPDSQEACELKHVCALAISSAGGAGTGAGTTIKTFFESASQGEPPPNLPFTLTETIDYAHPVSKGVHGDNGPGACYPGSGVMAIAVDASSTLVLDIVGQACQVGSNTAQLVFTGSYVSDAASSGTVSNPDGIGTVNIVNPSGLPGTGSNMKASLVGQLKYGD